MQQERGGVTVRRLQCCGSRPVMHAKQRPLHVPRPWCVKFCFDSGVLCARGVMYGHQCVWGTHIGGQVRAHVCMDTPGFSARRAALSFEGRAPFFLPAAHGV